MRMIDCFVAGLTLFALAGCSSRVPPQPPKADAQTGLIWAGNNDIRLNWAEANAYCRQLNLEEQTDWRLPAIKELQTLVDINKSSPAAKKGFGVASRRYWSSTPDASFSERAWYVFFKSGGTYKTDKLNVLSVKCVRDSDACPMQ